MTKLFSWSGILPAFGESATTSGLQLGDIIDQLPDPMLVKDKDLRWIYANQAFCDLVGASRDACIGKTDADFFPAHQAEAFCQADRSVMDVRNTVEQEEKITSRAGRSHLMRTKRICFTDRLGSRVLLRIMHDITRREEMETLLVERGARLDSVIATAVDGFVTTDEKGMIESFNPACERIFGYEAKEVLGRNIGMLMPKPESLYHEDHLRRYRETGEAHILGTTRETRARRKDGGIFPIDLSVNAVRFGEELIFSSIVRDITTRKEQEESLRRSLQKILETNTELERFAYVASHDLQEPLRMIGNFSNLLRESLGARLTKDEAKYVQIISDSVTRMRDLVTDFLEYSRHGHETVAPVSSDCNGLLKQTLENLSAVTEETGATITHDVLPVVAVNPIRFVSLMQNLIGNAIKYRRPQVAPVVHVGVRDRDSEWLIRVSDNGIGMREDYLEKIFEPFKRLHDRSSYPGTGMGLAICRKIVTGFGGKIWAESESGQGCSFFFTLPKTSFEGWRQ